MTRRQRTGAVLVALGSATVRAYGSPQAAAAYDRWLDRQADEHMEALYGDDEDRDAQGWSYEPDPDEAYDRMMDDCMEREAEETWH